MDYASEFPITVDLGTDLFHCKNLKGLGMVQYWQDEKERCMEKLEYTRSDFRVALLVLLCAAFGNIVCASMCSGKFYDMPEVLTLVMVGVVAILPLFDAYRVVKLRRKIRELNRQIFAARLAGW